MSAARSRKHRRIQPYAWLGAGAVTLGMGASMLAGAAVAFADDAADAGNTTTTASDTSATAPSPNTTAPSHRQSRVARSASGASTSAGTSSSPSPSSSVRQRASVSAPEPAAAVVDVPAPDAVTAPAANEPVAAPSRVTRRAPAPLAISDVATNWLAPKTAAAPAASASLVTPPSPPSNLAPNYNVSWLPGGSCTQGGVCVDADGNPPPNPNAGDQIVPGSYVAQARQEISATQGLIFQKTFGSGNIFAGIAGLVPELFLAASSLSLGLWDATNKGVQGFVASTAGIPLIHQVAQVTLLTNMLLPAISDFNLGAAGFFLPVVGFLGADIAAPTATLESAQQNGKVYAIVGVRTYAGTQPLVNAKVNNSNLSLLVDTGASGLLTTKDKVNTAGLTKVGEGSIDFSGNPGDPFNYSIYEAPVDFGGGAVTGAGATINVIEEDGDVARFKDFIFYADGILGVGANSDGPGIAPIPTATLPGELKDGALLFQNFWPFGLGGFMVFGLNPLPVKVSLPGTPDAFIKVGVNGAAPINNQAPAIIDSGGVFGTIRDQDIPDSLQETIGGVTYVKPNVTITGYTPDGTKLYSYTTVSEGTPVIGNAPGDYMNTGNAAFSQNPVYFNYGAGNGTANYGIGSTDFSIW